MVFQNKVQKLIGIRVIWVLFTLYYILYYCFQENLTKCIKWFQKSAVCVCEDECVPGLQMGQLVLINMSLDRFSGNNLLWPSVNTNQHEKWKAVWLKG